MPKTWPIFRKEAKFITRPMPGKRLEYSLPMNVLLRDLLKKANSTRESRYILKNKQILVNGKKTVDIKQPVGLMDVISFPELKEDYRILLTDKGKLECKKISEKQNIVISKIIKKTMLKGKLQLNLIDSRNIMVEKDQYKIGDSIVLEVPSQKIIKHLKLEKEAYVLIVAGKNIGFYGTIENIAEKNIILHLEDGTKIETLKEYAFVIGKKSSEIELK